ncbi:MAG TPA: hypothetical protein VLZ54_11895 [Arenibacter sp.]|nr:hypothetical protein [Arenibacter sp.]
MAHYDGNERREKIPDWAKRILVTAVCAISGALFSVWNDNIVTKQDVINIKQADLRQDSEIDKIRTEVSKQSDFNRRAIDKLDTLIDQDRHNKRR